jgi:predicted TPR repeat methyltransferase
MRKLRSYPFQESLSQAASRLHKAGNLSESADLYSEMQDAQPADFDALYALALTRQQAGAFDDSLLILRRALALNPRFAEGWRLQGTLLRRLKRWQDALACFDTALSLDPRLAEALSSRAAVLAETSRPAESLATLDRMLALQPDDAAGWNNRGSVLVSMLRLDEALVSFDRALAIDPDFIEALNNRAVMLLQLLRLDEALATCDAAVRLRPDHAVSWNTRGNALVALKRYQEAVASYDRALEIEPALDAATENRDLALLELKRLTRCPPGYLRGLFDEFSSDYDQTMLEVLGYQAHLHLRRLADRVLAGGPSGRRILDLGSGTGLVGEAFKDLAKGGRLDGVDLSPRMIDEASRRGIYDSLILGDIETMLQVVERRYDLILAADTMIYFGDLAPTFAGVFQRLVPGGFYVFAVERMEGHGWEQTEDKRFRHGEGYLRAAAAGADLDFVDLMECVLRRQGNEPVPGLAVALRKPAA